MPDWQQLQPWWRQPNPLDWFRSWGESIGWLNNYFNGFHTDQYYTQGLVKSLATVTNEVVRKTVLKL